MDMPISRKHTPLYYRDIDSVYYFRFWWAVYEEVKMLPREKLIQCFNCKHSIDCWGLNEDVPQGKDENAYSIPTKALTFLMAKNMNEGELSIKEQFGMFCAAFLQTLRHDQESDLRVINQILNVLCACSNSSGTNWHCPGENPELNEKWTYEPREDD